MLKNNPPTSGLSANASYPSNVLSVIKSFLNATGRPLESSMIILLVQRFPEIGVDLTQEEYDVITNNNVKIFPVISSASYEQQFGITSRSYQTFSNLASNTNGHFIIGPAETLYYSIDFLMNSAYTNSLTFTRNIGSKWFDSGKTNLGKLKVPRSRLGSVSCKVTITVETQQKNAIGAGSFNLTISQPGSADKLILTSDMENNFHYAFFQLKPSVDSEVSLVTSMSGNNVFVRFWTESVAYHYGLYAAIDDPMGNFPLPSVDEYNGATLRMRVMNDCYTDFAGSIIISDCNGVISAKYDSIQNIPPEYIFADEGSFPHYPFVPYFCDSVPKNNATCVAAAQSKYDIQFVASEFTVIRSFQCRPGVGSVNSKCQQVDANGNYYCTRDKIPYKRGPTGQLTDCLGHGHLEFDFDDTQSYICVCDEGYAGESCEQSA